MVGLLALWGDPDASPADEALGTLVGYHVV